MSEGFMHVQCTHCKQLYGNHHEWCPDFKPKAPPVSECPECTQIGGAHFPDCSLLAKRGFEPEPVLPLDEVVAQELGLAAPLSPEAVPEPAWGEITSNQLEHISTVLESVLEALVILNRSFHAAFGSEEKSQAGIEGENPPLVTPAPGRDTEPPTNRVD